MSAIGKNNYTLLNINCISPAIKLNNLGFSIVKPIDNLIYYDSYEITYCRELYYRQLLHAFIFNSNIIEKHIVDSIISKRNIFTLLVSTVRNEMENQILVEMLNIIEEDLEFCSISKLIKIASKINTLITPDLFLLESPIEWFYGGPLVSAYLFFIKFLFMNNKKPMGVNNLNTFIENCLKSNKNLIDVIATGYSDTIDKWEYVIKNYALLKNTINTGKIPTEYDLHNYTYGIYEATKNIK